MCCDSPSASEWDTRKRHGQPTNKPSSTNDITTRRQLPLFSTSFASLDDSGSPILFHSPVALISKYWLLELSSNSSLLDKRNVWLLFQFLRSSCYCNFTNYTHPHGFPASKDTHFDTISTVWTTLLRTISFLNVSDKDVLGHWASVLTMKATPLLIAWHNDNAPIYSVHFDPNGKGRLATAGKYVWIKLLNICVKALLMFSV